MVILLCIALVVVTTNARAAPQEALRVALSRAGFAVSAQPSSAVYAAASCERSDRAFVARVRFAAPDGGGGGVTAPAYCGRGAVGSAAAGVHAVSVQTSALASMLQAHVIGSDVALVGPKGAGKSAVARSFAAMLGYRTVLFGLHADMTARDLVQRRSTDEAGNTSWECSPVVSAALRGDLLVLDGIDRIAGDTLSVLQRLCQDRELDLFDGSRLVSWERYAELAAAGIVPPPPDMSAGAAFEPVRYRVTAADLGEVHETRIYPIHPAFRVLALAAPPTVAKPWLHSGTVSMFSFVTLPDVVGVGSAREDGLDLLRRIHGASLPPAAAAQLLSFCDNMNRYAASILAEDAATSQALTISLRQLLRLARGVAFQQGKLGHSASVGAWELYESAQESLLSQFLPASARAAVDGALRAAGIARPDDMYATTRATAGNERTLAAERVTAGDGTVMLKLGDLTMPLRRPAHVRGALACDAAACAGAACSDARTRAHFPYCTCSRSWFRTPFSTISHIRWRAFTACSQT